MAGAAAVPGARGPRVARCDREVAGLHVQLPRPRSRPGDGERRVEGALQLRLHGPRIATLPRRREGDGDEIADDVLLRGRRDGQDAVGLQGRRRDLGSGRARGQGGKQGRAADGTAGDRESMVHRKALGRGSVEHRQRAACGFRGRLADTVPKV
jgi:hypothetical protein